jgi:RNA polymerase sigma-70 factor (ECF subfamily)
LQFYAFDDSYLQRLRSGDSQTQQHFILYFTELMQLKLRSRRCAPETIEDVQQETFRRVFDALQQEGKIRHADRLGPYVNSVCNNVWRESVTRPPREAPLEDDRDLGVPDRGPDVLTFMIARQNIEKVRRVLEDLPERDRRILKAVFIEEEEKDGVCQDFGVSRDYLRVLLHRAKQMFKSQFLKDKSKGDR